MPERVRSFMAVLLPDGLKEEASAKQGALRLRFPSGTVRWVAKENFHLTVRFFGDLDRKALNKAMGVVEEMDGAWDPIDVRLGEVSAFPSPARPQTLWVEVVDSGKKLDALAASIDRKIREAGFGPADKPWRSHLTLGRAGQNRGGPNPRPPEGWNRGLTEERDPAGQGGLTDPAAAFTISSVALMQSELRPQGPLYTPLRIATATSKV